jgi:hypothetical protein
MEYACEDCVVDAICQKNCFKYRLYLHTIDKSNKDFTYNITYPRYMRIYNISRVSGVFLRHYKAIRSKLSINKIIRWEGNFSE